MTDFAVGAASIIEPIQQADADLAGYPLASDRSGPGYHSPAAPAVTLWVHNVRSHPTLPLFAYPSRDGLYEMLSGLVSPEALAAIAAAGPLDPDWTPAGPNLHPTQLEIAQNALNPSEKTYVISLTDSRWTGMSEPTMTMADVAWVGMQFGGFAYSAPASHTVEQSAQTAGSAPTNSLAAEAPDWFDRGNYVAEFTGTNVPTADLNERMVNSSTFSLANVPDLWGKLLGEETRLRGWLYAINDKVTSSPGIGLWWRADNVTAYGANSPGSGYYDYASLGADQYAEVELIRSAGWASSNNVVALHWCAEGGAATTLGELAAMSQFIVESTDVGLVFLQWGQGGAHLDTHFLSSTAFPPELLSTYAPLIGEKRVFHVDLGTNGGDADGDFLAHMKQLIALCRVGTAANAAVWITTAYDASTDAGEKPYVKLLYQLQREVPGVIVLDTRAALPAYDEGVAAGYYGDITHYNATGEAVLASAVNDLFVEVESNGAYHSGYLGTDLTTDPMQVGVEFELSGIGSPGSAVVVTVNGEAWGSTTCASNGAWSITNTPTVAMRGAGADVNVVVTFGPTRATTRPTTIAAE